ncbi:MULTISPECIES: GH92 family glycosyl hydrolase [unclassified Leeuwenhoekiella]|uniref:GH92 family glycosyl hydrolase n=1 Tax=unclassified Leeuwenhoekiella TaxID=2615029 RepID=UPI000C43FA7F|nr:MULTISPECIES: GH92 family glycosyl hydrolase [unclassified Leeuwenhoekiella]MAW94391.1 alpha-mannosidase [Leeuwenhoekiella sp.]MBA81068.1 alpha-mannosidase [Leeuwenhoekiella sp.]|tara:strand:- start:2206 stop:4497 length:2292 start_codon:yes stop_codon:yes gene_type:complete
MLLPKLNLNVKTYSKIIALGIFTAFFSCKNEKSEAVTPKVQKDLKLSAYVDPFIGTGGHGHTYPGATVPFGMVQVSPDNGRNGWDWCSGYHYSDSIISGFSNLHLSGTGIGDLADIFFMPAAKELDLTGTYENPQDRPYASSFSHKRESAEPGYYMVYLQEPEIKVGLTATQRTAFQKYNYEGAGEASVVLDLGFAINWDAPVETAINVENETTISGYRHSTGWAKNQKVFFVAEFSKPMSRYNLFQNKTKTEAKQVTGKTTAAQFFFDIDGSRDVIIKIAVSSVSVANAKANLESDRDLDFETARAEAKKTWEQQLEKIVVETPVDSLKTIFYSALYHTQIAPVTFSDVNGEFRLENDSIVKADYTAYSTLSLWDTFRAENPLLTLLEPEKVSDIINSMLAYYSVHKSLPIWTLYGNETNTMTGNHAIPVITEAYFKGITSFDAEKAYAAMKNTQMRDERGLQFLKEYGYIPYDKIDESVTFTLEYAYNDWCVAQMAKALGHEQDYEYFLNRSKSYEKLYDPETGFMRGKSAVGNWHEPFDPKFSRHRENTDYTEGNAWQHSWFVLHDTDNFIKLHGGEDAFTQMLQQLFTESSEITGEHISNDISGLIGQYAHGNEPSHHIAYLFNRAGKPWLTQYWVHEILKTQYNTTPNGLSGNEDAGQMSAWYVWSAMGLYPFNPASAAYEIGSPVFEKSVITLPDGKNFSIIAEGVSEANFYIQSATLNGKPFNQTSITHEQIMAGGELALTMGDTPAKNWGVKQAD